MAKITGDFSFRWVKISRKGTAVRIIVPVLLLVSKLIIFLPHVGRGFITDDFIWINSIIHNGSLVPM
ncbi:MAG: hypothetical protein KAT34_22465, partial [Candidatus Aminicenantes bacterium]|nr:hypothetical protein [Candidatus Aminicenantes bacterium]